MRKGKPETASPAAEGPTHEYRSKHGAEFTLSAGRASAALADHFVKAEPVGLYQGTTRVYGIVKGSAGRVTSAVNNRIVSDVFTAAVPMAVKYAEQRKQEKHADNKCGEDAPQFHHECTSATFQTPTHTAHTIHMCTASVAAKALRNYARLKARAIGNYP